MRHFITTAARRATTTTHSRVAARPVFAKLPLRGMAGSTVHGQDPDRLAREKARNLKGEQESSAPHKDHAPGWNENLASESEANVKADQAGPQGKPGKELQDKTVKQTHEHHHGEGGKKGQVKPPQQPTESEASVRAEQGEKVHH